jgi:hypothetical protein
MKVCVTISCKQSSFIREMPRPLKLFCMPVLMILWTVGWSMALVRET